MAVVDASLFKTLNFLICYILDWKLSGEFFFCTATPFLKQIIYDKKHPVRHVFTEFLLHLNKLYRAVGFCHHVTISIAIKDIKGLKNVRSEY